MKERTAKYINDFFERHDELKSIEHEITEVISMWIDTYRRGNKILLCGNGGSCADCDHIAGELLKGFLLKRPVNDELKEKLVTEYGESGARLACSLQQGLPAISLSAHRAAISAFANDVDAELVYAQQVLAYGKEGDLIMGISTSGNAKNVNAAVITANAMGMKSVGLSGRDGGMLAKNCNTVIVSKETETYRIQEDHLAIYHLLCAATEYELFDK